MALREIYGPEFIMERYHCGSLDTARRYMREMGAKGAPFFVTEEMITAWEDTKRKCPDEEKTKRPRLRAVAGEMVIPRRK